MKTNTKKYLKVLSSIGLVAAIAAGFTLAYLTADTGSKVNSFTGSDNITGETTETEWKHENGWDYFPGEVAAKNPTVQINGTEDAWVGMTIKVIDKTEDPDNGVEIPLSDFITNYGIFQTKVGEDLVDGMNTIADRERPVDNPTKWTAVDDGFYVYNSVVAAKTSATPLFDAVKINAGIYKYYEKSTGTETVYIYDVDENGEEVAGTRKEVTSSTWVTEDQVLVNEKGEVVNTMKLPTFEIVAHGYAVQSNLTFDEAIAELTKLAK